jgi:hypothetical protein
MKRDMTLVREILLAIEGHPAGQGPVDVHVPGCSSEVISYHVKIMAEAGLIEALNATTMQNFSWKPTMLTWQGHEFLDAVRNDTVWRKTTALIKEKGGSVPFEVVKALAVKVAGSLFGLS